MKSNVIKFIFLFQIWALLSANLVSAQTVVTIGTGTATSENYPFNGYYNYSWSNVIYKASDIGTDGLITKVAFYVNNTRSSNYVMNSQKIYARHTTSNAYTATTYPGTTGFTLVYDGTITYAANTTGWKEITLTTSFSYNGTNNLEFLFENRDGSYIVTGFPYFRCTTGLTDVRTRRDYADASFPSTCSSCLSLTVIPNIQLTIQPCGITLGTVAASPATVLPGIGSTLSITGQDQTSTLQWQSSTDNVTFANISGATSTTYVTGALYDNKYYRVQQSNNGCVKYTTSALVTVDLSTLTTSSIGTGTTLFDKYPFNGYYNYSWSSLIYKASEISSTGRLARVSFYVDNSPVNFVMDNQKIYVRHTTASAYSTSTYPGITGFTLIYDGSITYNGTGWKEIVLSNMFDYNGTDNLEFLFENRDGSYGTDYPIFRGQTATETRVKRDYYDPSFPSTCNLCASYNNILNIKMKFLPCIITLGTVAASPANMLPGATSTISITGQEQGATIQWQSSTDNITFANISGATSATYAAGALYENKYYRVQLTKNGCSKFTASTLVTINTSTLTTSTIGTGVAITEKYPFNGYYNYSWSSLIYKAGEIGAAGKLARVSFYVDNSPVNFVMDNQKIYVRHITTSAYTETAYPGTTGFTLVYDGSVTYNGTGWKEIVLNNLFDYNGIDNLEFLFENRDGSYGTDYPIFRGQSGMSGNRVKRDYGDLYFPSSCNLCASFNNILNIKMKFLPCDYNEGTVAAANTSVFPGNTTTVSVSGQDPAATIQWQSSTDNISFTSISGATSAQYITTGCNQDKYYRVQLIKNGCAKLSNTALVAIDISMLITSSIGTGTDLFDKYPFDGYYNYSWSSLIYKASEINVTGRLSRVSFYVDNSPVNCVMDNQKIYVRHTTANGYTETAYPGITGFTLVYNGSITYNGTGWKEIVLDNTFDYNGTDNLEFLFENRDGSYTTEYPIFRGQVGMTENRVKRDFNDATFPSTCVTCGTFNNIINIKMKFLPNQTAGYFRSVQSGNWNQISTWQTSSDNTTWVAANTTPNNISNTITIQSAHTVTITASTTIDQTIVNGTLIYGDYSGSTFALNNGTGSDLIVNGTFQDVGPNSIAWTSGTTWNVGNNGTLVRTRSTSSNEWRDNYDGGISTIPATANWIIRKTGTDNPSLTSIGGMYYPNLTIENTSGVAWTTGIGSNFTGSSDYPRIKGDLNIGGNGTSSVTFINQNTNPIPVLVERDLIVHTASTLQNNGTGFNVMGNMNILGNYNGTKNLQFSGNNTQIISSPAFSQLKNLTINKSGGRVILGESVTIDSVLTLTSGVLVSDSLHMLVINNTASVSRSSGNSYISGPVKKIGNTAFTFPLGDTLLHDSIAYHPLSITASSGSNDAFIAQYFSRNQTFGDSLDLDSLESISSCEFWSLNHISGTSTVIPTLGWNTNSCNIYNGNDLRLAGWNGTNWISMGNGGVVINGKEGNLSAIFPITTDITHLVIGANRPPNRSLTNSRNYIYTITSKIGTNSETVLNNLPFAFKKEEIHYFDGLGREDQTVYKHATPQNNDFVQPIIYDQYGRQSITYLPYAETSADGSYRTNAISNQNAFYNNSPRVAHSSVPFSETTFDNSPLNKVIEQSAPGTDWQMGNGHTIKQNYRTNYNNEVLLWDIVNENPISTTSYTAMELYVSQIIDEQGNYSLEFKDKLGRLILIKKQIGTSSLQQERSPVPIQPTVYPVYQETYFVYDLLGNLSAIIPPKAIELMNTTGNYNASLLNEDLIFQYKYDQRNRLVKKKVPGAGWIFNIYNTLDQLVLTQDAQQRVNLKWTFFKFDILGRVVLTGLFDAQQYAISEGGQPPSDNPFNYWINTINGYTLFEKRSDVLYSTNHGYTNYAFPQTFIDIQNVNYYDDYDFDNTGTPDENFRTTSIPCITIPSVPFTSQEKTLLTINCTPYINTASNRTRGKVTASKTKLLDPSSNVQWLKSINFYDDKGQVIQIQSNNQFGGTDIVDNVYDFSGKIIHTAYEHKKTSTAQVITILNKYIYDQGDRLIKVYQQNNNDTPIMLSQNLYNELGQLIEENLHKVNDVAVPLQSVDYSYNIRSWLTHINNSDLSNDKPTGGGASVYYNDDDNDLFGMEINYNEINSGLENNKLFNGNISQIQWQSATDNVKKGYAYQYNPLKWITNASYKEYNTITSSWTQNIGKFNVSGISYDANGNILSMKQNGFLTNSTFGEMDNLNYSYSGNRIVSVNDLSPTNGFNDFKDNGTNNSIEYTYDNNGNCITDANKGTVTTYNHLNLPTQITFTNGNKIEYIYDANGTRLQKKSTPSGGNASNTYYSGSIVYGDYGLDFISTPKGRIVADASAGQQFRYEYSYKDQVGDTRLIFSDLNRDGVIDKTTEVLQQVSYYPFGLEMKGLNTIQIGAENKFKFNGKELDDDFGLQLNNFSARIYDPQLGRMNCVDPMADFMPSLTPFRFAFNNPISVTDQTGMFEEENIGENYDMKLEKVEGVLTDFKDKDGKLIKHVEDGSNAVFQLTGNDWSDSYFKFVGYDEKQGGKNVANTETVLSFVEDYTRETYKSTPVSYKDKDGNSKIRYQTYCNFGTRCTANSYASALKANGVELDVSSFKGSAGDIYNALIAKYTAATLEEAQKAAKEGSFVVGGWKSHAYALNKDGLINNVGAPRANNNIWDPKYGFEKINGNNFYIIYTPKK